MFEWLKAILILPFNVVITIPYLILHFSNYNSFIFHKTSFITGCLLLVSGLLLAGRTMVLFNNAQGTLAPWNPPKKLVVKGPYCYVRNPMIISILIILAAESLLLNAVQIIWWAVIFFIINNIHFYVFEEKQLEQRFKESYLLYKKNVPMWIPRLTPWKNK